MKEFAILLILIIGLIMLVLLTWRFPTFLIINFDDEIILNFAKKRYKSKDKVKQSMKSSYKKMKLCLSASF